MYWLELAVKVHPEAVESVSELLRRYTSEGVVIEEPIELIGEGQEYRVREGEPVAVRAYLPVDGKEEEARQRIAEGLWHLGSLGERFVGPLQTRTVNEEDWANAWKEHYYVTHIGQRIVIRPSWREYSPQPGEVVLTLDPGMAFGTGLHPTTRMCLEQIERHLKAGMHVLDVGTGSGILALAAARLGAADVYAIDNSNVAVASASENVTLNNLTDRIRVVAGELDEAEAARLAGRYDLVVANILAHVIGAMAPELARVLAPGGILIASGIIEARRRDAEEPLLAAGLELAEVVQSEDWLALVLRKNANRSAFS
ncbi:MAG: 50S ribosomal protein L11 methyltransferase [Ktedonobacteraceae bacterium]|nr:50S ribosomal protein L11 methyltransferase [Ktedonobacteraceae bacterium]